MLLFWIESSVLDKDYHFDRVPLLFYFILDIV